MRGGSLQKFKVYTPGGGQKGGTLFKFATPNVPPPFLGTWDQIQRQRGAGLPGVPPPFLGTWDQIPRQRGAGLGAVKRVFSDFKKGASTGLKRGWNTKSLSEAKRGVKRAASNALYNEIDRTAKKKLKDIFGV